jgi:hypothetical protein
MVMSEVPLRRQEELVFVLAHELRPALAASDSPVPFVDCGRLADIDADGRHLCLRPAENVVLPDLGVHCDAPCNFRVVDTFPKRCRRQSAPLR